MRWLMRMLPTRALKTLIAWLGGEEEQDNGYTRTGEGPQTWDEVPPGIIKLRDEPFDPPGWWRFVPPNKLEPIRCAHPQAVLTPAKCFCSVCGADLPRPDQARGVSAEQVILDEAQLLSDRDLLSEDEKALFEQISPEAPEKVIAYPPKVEDPDAKAWVTAELEHRTGGITRHPMDVTNYPEPPTEADKAAREQVFKDVQPGARVGLFSHGYSMRHLNELVDRAKAKDPTLTDEQLMGLRARGLI